MVPYLRMPMVQPQGTEFRSQHPDNQPGVISIVPLTPMPRGWRVEIRGLVGLPPSWPSRNELPVQVDLASKE